MLALESEPVSVRSGKKNLREELDEISKSVPNFSYRFNKINPRIIHIIDASLLRQSGYALNVRLKRISFTGTVDALMNAIKEQGASVAQESTLVTTEAAVVDYRTVVTVKGRGLIVRDALSNFVPLDKRSSRIIWIARTNLAPKAISKIHFIL